MLPLLPAAGRTAGCNAWSENVSDQTRFGFRKIKRRERCEGGAMAEYVGKGGRLVKPQKKIKISKAV
jgi:hypothetical protein